MISRHWRGLAKTGRAADYISHLKTETFPALAALPGFAGAELLRRDLPQGVEFLVITNWASVDAIHAFAGRDAEAAVVPAAVQAMMVEYDERARHFNRIE
jgi:heme-degrading monooxygenase HmoA